MPGDRTWLVGLVGEHIAASRSPDLHEQEARAIGAPYVYRLIDLAGRGPGALADALEAAILLGFDGLNVTHPFKQSVMPLLDEVAADARLIGAVNTVRISGGRTIGYNTDGLGFAAAMRIGLPDVRRERVVQFGAGGAGAATARALIAMGVKSLTLIDRDRDRADALAERIATAGCEIVAHDADPERVAASVARADGVVHATPTGMAQYPGTPFDPALLRPDLWVADIVYMPLETALLREARRRGCRTLDGGMMVVHQAAEAIKLIAGLPVDPHRMRTRFLNAIERGEQE